MRLLLVLLLIVLIVLPTDGWRRRRRRRWIRIRAGKVVTGLGVAARLGLIGKRDVQDDLASADLNEDGNIDQSEAENLFDKRDADQIMQMADMDGDSVVSHDEFIRGLEDLFAQDVQDGHASADLNEDGNIDQSEAENLFDKRDAEQILQMADMDGDSVVSHDEFIRGLDELFAQDAE